MASVRPRPVVIALVAILAITLAAATLNTAVTHDGPAGADGRGGSGGIGEGTPGDGQLSGDEADPSSVGFAGRSGPMPVIPLPCFPVLNAGWFLGAVAVVVGTGLYVLYRSRGPLVPIAVVGAFGPPAVLVHALLTACRAARDRPFVLTIGNRSANESVSFWPGGGFGAGGAAGGSPAAALGFFVVLGLALAVAVVLLVRATGDDASERPNDPETDPIEAAAVGRAAGRAADRIEAHADVDNAIYRAWKEMTDRLEVANPDASTPAEFAAAAVDAGMDRDDVAELTSLFEAVRYGTTSPTPAREARAVAALRRIEETYAGGEP